MFLLSIIKVYQQKDDITVIFSDQQVQRIKIRSQANDFLIHGVDGWRVDMQKPSCPINLTWVESDLHNSLKAILFIPVSWFV